MGQGTSHQLQPLSTADFGRYWGSSETKTVQEAKRLLKRIAGQHAVTIRHGEADAFIQACVSDQGRVQKDAFRRCLADFAEKNEGIDLSLSMQTQVVVDVNFRQLRGKEAMPVDGGIARSSSSDFFASMSNDVFAFVVKDFSAPFVARLKLVSRAVYHLASSNQIWFPLFLRVFGKCSRLNNHSWNQAFQNTANLIHTEEYLQKVYASERKEWTLKAEEFCRMKKEEKEKLLTLPIAPDYPPVACGIRFYPPPPIPKPSLPPLAIPLSCGFSKHPDSTFRPAEEFSVNLISASHAYLLYNQQVFGSTGGLTSSSPQSLLQKAICDKKSAEFLLGRYSRFLRLKLKYPTVLLVPTLDIEMVWQSHLLRPDLYEADLKKLKNGLVDHSLMLNLYETNVKKQAFRDTEQLWELEFGEPYLSNPKNLSRDNPNCEKLNDSFFGMDFDEPLSAELLSQRPTPPIRLQCEPSYDQRFVIPTKNDLKEFSLPNLTSLEACELKKDSQWYTLMMSDCSSDEGDLEAHLKSYERMLFLCASNCDQISRFHPSFKTDIIWHAHMMYPVAYRSDTRRLVGHDVVHLPWPHDEEKMRKNRIESIELLDSFFNPLSQSDDEEDSAVLDSLPGASSDPLEAALREKFLQKSETPTF